MSKTVITIPILIFIFASSAYASCGTHDSGSTESKGVTLFNNMKSNSDESHKHKQLPHDSSHKLINILKTRSLSGSDSSERSTNLSDNGTCKSATSCTAAGNHKINQGDFNTAMTYFIKACECQNSNGCSAAGKIYKDTGEFSKARKYLKMSIEQDNSGTYGVLGEMEEFLGNRDVAIKYYLTGASSSSKVHELLKAIDRYKSEEVKEKQSRCDNENDSNSCISYGVTSWHAREIAVARTYLTKTCNLDNIHGCFFLGILESKNGNFSDATTYLLKACDNGRPEACDKIGQMEENRGNYDTAIKYYQKANVEGYKYAENHISQLKSKVSRYDEKKFEESKNRCE